MTQFSDLSGQTLLDIRIRDGSLVFVCSGGAYWMGHRSDCCEVVEIEDVDGDPRALIGAVIAVADAPDSRDLPARHDTDESWTWTFYRIQTSKGDVTIRWYGESSGYYSEDVEIERFESVDRGLGEDPATWGIPWNPAGSVGALPL